MFGKMDKRQGYHIIISFPTGEATEEQAFEITRRFAEEFLGEKYEVVYFVYTDKEHKHGHIIWNSVDMQTGRKYEYKKGDWKYKYSQLPINFARNLDFQLCLRNIARNLRICQERNGNLSRHLKK